MLHSAWLRSFRSWLSTLCRLKPTRTQRRARGAQYSAEVRLLEPRTLLAAAFSEFVDPHPSSGNQFGATVVPLSTGNVVITAPYDDAGGANAGAVYLFNGATGALISTLVGSSANDTLGSGGVTALSNGNFVVNSPLWDNGVTANVGAVTWGSGTTGVNGIISAANSLIGTLLNDNVGYGGVTALNNGNYVVNSYSWDSGVAADAGAVTWGSGITGVKGVVSAANSLIGSSAGDNLGYAGVTALPNGNYVVKSYLWDNGAATNAGAVTWANGTTGIVGTVNSSNSLVGTSTDDNIGYGGVTALSNGNYVVNSYYWDNGAAADVGAVTWGNGTTGVKGVVSAANSLVGSNAGDTIGSTGVTALSNGNYVVSSSSWDNGAATHAGAVTWGNGATGISGVVSAANSLVGNATNNSIGSDGVTALSNGNYVVISPYWDDGATTDAGAVTRGNGATGITGVVTAANSLIGSSANDNIGRGGVTALSNGNYVVLSPFWDSGATTDAGAATWGSGTLSINGAVSSANSLVGSSASDKISSNGVTALSNGNYVVVSPFWDSGATPDVGAATWGNGTIGSSGTVSAINSLVGSSSIDKIASNGVTALSNGNYVVISPFWDNGMTTDAGAATWGNGTTGVKGVVSASNSLVGGTSGDNIGYAGVTALTNGNYVVNSYNWDNGSTIDVGAVTWGNGTTGVKGLVSAVNSLVGNATLDLVGSSGGAVALSNGNYVVICPFWDNGATTNAGAVTWVDGTTGLAGTVSSANSAVGLSIETGLGPVVADNLNNTAFGRFLNEGGGRVRVGSQTTGFVNFRPVIGGAVANQAVNDNATKAVFSTLTVTDPDTNPMSAAVTILNGVVRGDFIPATTIGWTRTVIGNNIRYARTYASAANIGATIQAAIRNFVFQPRSNAIKPNTTEATVFTVTVSDGIASPVSNSTTSVITTSVNNAPTFGGTSANVAVNDNATVNPFTALTVSDVDMQELLISVTILNGVVRGDFTPASTTGWATRYTTGNDITYKRYFSPQANVGAAAQVAFRSLVFQPRQNAINPGTTELTDFLVTVSDGVAPAVLGTGTRVTTTSINNVPVITGTIANQPMNDNQSRAVFNTVTITDADTDDMNVIITIPNGVNRGDFTAATTTDLGWTRTVVGIDIRYNRYFGPQANIGSVVQPYINAMIFRPRTNVPIGTTETTGFTIFLNDGLANTTNSTASVITTGVAPRVAPSTPAVAAMFLDRDINTVIVPSVTKPRANMFARQLKKPS